MALPLLTYVVWGLIDNAGNVVTDRGIAAVIRNGAGNYSIELDDPISPADFIGPSASIVDSVAAVPVSIGINRVDDTHWDVFTYSEIAGVLALTDHLFTFLLARNEG